jgi:tryptophanyl-tRNA synthetase
MELLSVLNKTLEEPRARYAELMANPKKIDLILEEGASRVRPSAQKLVNVLKKTVGVQ